MDQAQHNSIVSFIWGIADDVLRDLYVRGKYRDVILPMTVVRRLVAVLEATKQAVLDMKESLDRAGITNQDAALRQAAGQDFYNTSKFIPQFLIERLNIAVFPPTDSCDEQSLDNSKFKPLLRQLEIREPALLAELKVGPGMPEGNCSRNRPVFAPFP